MATGAVIINIQNRCLKRWQPLPHYMNSMENNLQDLHKKGKKVQVHNKGGGYEWPIMILHGKRNI